MRTVLVHVMWDAQEKITSRPGSICGMLDAKDLGAGEPPALSSLSVLHVAPQHVSHRISDSPWRPASPGGSRLQHHGYRC